MNDNKSSTGSTAPQPAGLSTQSADHKAPNTNAALASGDAPPANVISASSQTLTLTYRSSKEDRSEDHYAVILFPKSYEEAVTGALELLAKYITNPQVDNVILRCSARNRNGEWIWADFKPEDWPLVVRPGDEVGVFEKPPKPLASNPQIFWHGSIRVVCGKKEMVKTEWELRDFMTIDRPTTYAGAVELIQGWVNNRIAQLPNHYMDEARRRLIKPGKILTFYLFTDDLKQWIPFPPIATTDDLVWKELVPPAGGILGVIAT
ncbi:hypothetical protein DFH07DRAFT_807679 [Mycena maculata]|uniref:Uncharacterized protein n=1 Tax=Mycena maculata TaxID=230809 RepID=A0AAD7NNU5_9AGAR|nr:hypothetical protein DFH07DRAFT_807679 [Mycena maculata]